MPSQLRGPVCRNRYGCERYGSCRRHANCRAVRAFKSCEVGPLAEGFSDNGARTMAEAGIAAAGKRISSPGRRGSVPRAGEGCDRHIKSLSECLQQLPANRVIQAVETMLVESKAYV